MKAAKRIITLCFIAFAVLSLCNCAQEKEAEPVKEVAKATEEKAPAAKKLKAGFVYVGAVGDYGWTHAHDTGRKFAEKELPWLETVYVESIAEADSSRIIDRFVQEEKCDVVFTTSFGYMDDTIAAGARYPDKHFMHCSGFKQSENVGTYFEDFYQLYYLNGLMAGAMTKTDKIGYVAAFPIPELLRHINAFALGIKAVNPEAKVHIKWIYSWFGPEKAREAAEALIAEGCDTLAFTEDTPAVIEVGQEHTEKGNQIYTFSHYSPMQPYGVDSVVSGQLTDWGPLYVKILKDLHEGTWSNKDILWLIKDKAVFLGGNFEETVNAKFVEEMKGVMVDTPDLGKLSAYDLVHKRYEQMKQGRDTFEPFTGPIKDNQGNVKFEEGKMATIGDLFTPTIMFYADNIVGDIPK